MTVTIKEGDEILSEFSSEDVDNLDSIVTEDLRLLIASMDAVKIEVEFSEGQDFTDVIDLNLGIVNENITNIIYHVKRKDS